MRKPLDTAAAAAALATLNARAAPGSGDPWRIAGTSLVKRYQFADFVAAFGFMSQLALIAERMDHHPEWSNVYRTVDIALTTHDASGLTGLDFELAERADAIAAGPRAG